MEGLTPYANTVLVKSLANVQLSAQVCKMSVTYYGFIIKYLHLLFGGPMLKINFSLEISTVEIVKFLQLIISIFAMLSM